MRKKTLVLFSILILSLCLCVIPEPIYATEDVTFYSTVSDGYLEADGVNYNSVWNASEAMIINIEDNDLWIGQYKSELDFYIFRAYLFFETSTIPDSATIDSATLHLYGAYDTSTQDFTITIQNGQPTYPHDPLVIGDYNKSYYFGNGGEFNTSEFVTTGYNIITLNADGRNWINKEGTTKLCIRSDREIAGTQPSNYECVGIWAYEKGEGYQPKLVVTYSVPRRASPPKRAPTPTTPTAAPALEIAGMQIPLQLILLIIAISLLSALFLMERKK